MLMVYELGVQAGFTQTLPAKATRSAQTNTYITQFADDLFVASPPRPCRDCGVRMGGRMAVRLVVARLRSERCGRYS